jgi:hypothetical protein
MNRYGKHSRFEPFYRQGSLKDCVRLATDQKSLVSAPTRQRMGLNKYLLPSNGYDGLTFAAGGSRYLGFGFRRR